MSFNKDKTAIIYFDDEEHGYLSNFHFSPILINDRMYDTVEHFFQASKATNNSEHNMVRTTRTPGKSKTMGRIIQLRENWEEIKFKVMLKGVRMKFNSHSYLGKLLIKTGDLELIEGNTWNDKIWGVYNGVGTNWLGKILMQVRKELKMIKEEHFAL